MKRFVLDWNIMKTWPPVLWGVFFALIVILVSLVVVLFKEYYQLSIVKWYGLWAACIGVWFYVKSRKAVDIHIHHYCIGMLVLAFTCYQDVFLTVVCGVFNGIMMEGGSRWGYDPVFTYPSTEDSV